jgi:2-hydroxy-3-keto-5-methylthiopentenyl-1-phosphate phosphatase
MEIQAPKAEYTSEGYRLKFPKLLYGESVNFKDDLVRYHKRQGSVVVYMGDGLGDYPAAKEANLPFAIKGSKLADVCRKGNVSLQEITDFEEVINALDSQIA